MVNLNILRAGIKCMKSLNGFRITLRYIKLEKVENLLLQCTGALIYFNEGLYKLIDFKFVLICNVQTMNPLVNIHICFV